MILSSILISCLIFCILYVTLNHFTYWLNVFVYAICFTIKIFIVTGLTATFGSIVLWFAINFVIGLFMVWILNKMVDSLSPLVFMFVAILIQEIVGYVLLLVL